MENNLLTIEQFKEVNNHNTNLGYFKYGEKWTPEFIFKDELVNRNYEIYKERQKAREISDKKINEPRIGDIVLLPNDVQVWISHVWTDSVQTSGSASCHIGKGGGMEYSGGLDSGLKRSDLIPTNERDYCCAWFFENDWARAHSAIYTKILVRVWKAKEDADFKGVPQYVKPLKDKNEKH